MNMFAEFGGNHAWMTTLKLVKGRRLWHFRL